MSRLLESIKIIDGSLQNLDYHQARIDFSLRKTFGVSHLWPLNRLISVDENLKKIHKCRFIYDDKTFFYQISPYEIRKIRTLRLTEADTLEYSLKWENRSHIEFHLDERGNADDIIMIKNGWITDASYANLAFFDGNCWHTPSTPLLAGTKRQLLIDREQLLVRTIRPSDLKKYSKVSLINAMLDLDDLVIPVENII